MPRPQQHTVIRISLRSMLAITTGVAVVMAVAGPFLRALDVGQQWHLARTVAVVALGMAVSLGLVVRKRYRLGQQCGALLLALERRTPKKKTWLRWLWLLVLMPVAILYFYVATSPGRFRSGTSSFFRIFNWYLPIIYSTGLARLGLALWAEGCTNAVELCENGILSDNKFHAWNSPALRDMYWGQVEGKLVININRSPATITVPPEQREAVDAILENYYRPSRLPRYKSNRNVRRR